MKRSNNTPDVPSQNKYIVAFNTNEGYPDSWFAAFDDSDPSRQMFTRTEAIKVKTRLLRKCSSQGKPILASVVRVTHKQVTINPRTKYVRIKAGVLSFTKGE